MKSAKQFGTESTVMRPVQSGTGRQMCQAYVVPKEEILSNPAFADFRLREGLAEGSSGVSLNFELKYNSQVTGGGTTNEDKALHTYSIDQRDFEFLLYFSIQ